MAIRARLARAERLILSDAGIAERSEHAAFLGAFEAASPRNAALVARLVAQRGTRELAQLLPETADDPDSLRIELAQRLAGWAIEIGADLPAGTGQTARIALSPVPSMLLANPAGGLCFVRGVHVVCDGAA